MRERSLEEMERDAQRTLTVCVIPCKVDSRRLEHKNFLEVDGGKMITHVMLKALNCPNIDLVAVSTDDVDAFLEQCPEVNSSVFEEVFIFPRGEEFRHPDTSIFMLILEALQTLEANNALEGPPTHVVMMQPNVPTIPQEAIDALVAAVVTGPHNVARHFCVSPFSVLVEDQVAGAMTGGCDAYKIGALNSPVNMDSYNFAVMTGDPEIHDAAELEVAERIMQERKK
jgi:hypothetical protein